MATTYANPDTEGETKYDDPDLAHVAHRELGRSALQDGPPTDAYDMSEFEDDVDSETTPDGEESGQDDTPNTAEKTEQKSLYNPEDVDSPRSNRKKKKVKSSSPVRRRVAFTIGGITFFAGVAGVGIVGVPMLQAGQLIHAGQSLKTHFSMEDKANDSRITQLYRFLFARGTSTCAKNSCIVKDGGAGDTRLNFLERRMKVSTLNELRAVGIELWTDRGGNYIGMRIEPSKNPELAGLNKEQIAKKLGIRSSDVNQLSDKRLAVRDSHITKYGQSKMFKFAMRSAGYPESGAMVWWRRWTLQKFVSVGFHPMREIDRRLVKAGNKAIDNWKKERAAKLRGASNPETVTIDTSNAEIEETDPDGNTTTKTPTDAGTSNASKGDIRNNIAKVTKSPAFRGTGVALGVVGIACMAREVYLGAGEINYLRNQKPLMNLATEIISSSEQTAAGMDFNDINLDLMNEVLESKDENGKRSSFSDAKSLRQTNGQSGGTDLSQEERDLIANSGTGPSYLAWTDEGPVGDALKTVCGDAASIGTTVLGVAIGFMSGSIVGTIVGGIAGMALGPAAMDFVSNAVSGNALDVANATGLKAGQYADRGAFMLSNLSALQAGGMPISQAEASTQQESYLNEQKEILASKSIAYRLFNAYDKDTLLGRVVDDSSISLSGNLAKLTDTFTNIGSVITKGFASLFTGKAAAMQAYDYGAPKVGLTTQELQTITSGNYDPFDNSYEVGVILDADTAGTYINKAKVCNGKTLYKDPTYGWSTSLGEDSELPLRKLLSGKLDPMCYETDTNWEKIRNFIGDLDNFEGMACWKDIEADTACANAGLVGADSLSSSADNPSISGAVGPATLARSQGAWGGYSNGQVPTTALTRIKPTDFPGNSTNVCDHQTASVPSLPYLNPSAYVSLKALNDAYMKDNGQSSGLLLLSCYRDLAGQEKARATQGENAATPGRSNHGWGLAVDFDNTSSYDSATYKWLMENAAKYGWVNPENMQRGGSGPHEPWHWEYARPVRTTGSSL